MIIKKLKLENIKSYVSEEINFTTGINFILGANGSGKTTIIESIGLALFNFSKNTQSDLIRYNKTKATIEVEFIANDGIKYRVVRVLRQKTSGTVKIIDVAGNNELYSGVSEVYSYIKNVLKIVKTKDFTKMFEEIIAVPQGQYVAAFLERPSTRKENFDRLFDLHIYKNINVKLNSLANNIKDNKISFLKEDIAKINGAVGSYDEKKSGLAEVIKQIKELSKKQEELEKEILETQTNKQKLEKTKDNISRLKNEAIIVEENIKNLTKQVEASNEDLKEAKKAQTIVEKNKKDYMKYQENAEQIANYEQKYFQYLEIESQIKTKENESIVIKNNIQNLEENKANKKNEFDSKHQEIIQFNTDSIFLKTEIEKLTGLYERKKTETNIELEEIILEKTQILSKLEKLTNYHIRYEERLIKDWTSYEDIDNQIKLVNEKISQINVSKNKYEKANEQRTKLAVELDNAIANSQISRDGNCPFFKEKCKNIDEKSLIEYFNNIIEEKKKEIDAIDTLIYKLKEESKDERKYISELQTLENNKKFLDDYNKNMAHLEKDFFLDFDKYIERKESAELDYYIDSLQTSLNERLEILKSDEEKINLIKGELVKEDTQINKLNYNNEMKKISINELESANKKLGEEIDAITSKLLMAKKNIIAVNKDIDNIKEKLLEVIDSKQILDNLKAENTKLEEFRNLYLSNVAKAKEVDKKIESIRKDNNQIDELKTKAIQIQNKIIELQNEYSDELLQEKTIIYMQLLESKGSVVTSISEKGMYRNQLQNEIMVMDNLFKERESKQIQLDRYNAINEFINRAKKIFVDLPRDLSIKYREHISNTATKIYRQISRERVQLELTEDYGVIIIEDDNPKNRKSIDVLSGGEQMSVAIAIRLSMLKGLTGLDIYFLDEPTVNLDQERRDNVADVVGEISNDLSQLFVISHDDTFDQITDTVIKIVKEENESMRG